MADPPPNPAPAPPDPEKARDIPDQLMVFHSNDNQTPKISAKEAKIQSKKNRIMARKSTPAPLTKGHGRKRFVPSPLPEDKQLKKKLDFGGEVNGESKDSIPGVDLDGPKCKVTLFATSSNVNKEVQGTTSKSKDIPGDEEVQTEMVVHGDEPDVAGEPPSDLGAAMDEMTVGGEEDNLLGVSQADLNVGNKTKSALGSEIVNFPEMGMGTNCLLESALVPYQNRKSHVEISSPLPMQQMEQNKSDILQVIDMTAAEMLDAEAAQPLLAGPSSTKINSTTLIHLASMDAADMLDAMVAQPLLDANQPEMARTAAVPRIEFQTVNTPKLPTCTSAFSPYQEQFPPLEKGRILKLRDNFEKGRPMQQVSPSVPRRNSVQQEVRRVAAVSANPQLTENGANMTLGCRPDGNQNEKPPNQPATMANLFNTKPASPRNKEGSGGPEMTNAQPSGGETNPRHNAWRSMAEMVKGTPDPSGPQAFEPEKIQNIGIATVSNGVPAIYFSGMEIRKLAENVGHAIVGKFSHSIPSAAQIQKALDNIKFRCGFTWKYINAKHILIQCEELTDYARLLSGPKGTPVWFIDRHPMRVFKWSPDFDAYCESPIAAIWCNLIGLPIHLFDHSALFAIGKLLGTPIQVDRATANKTRLSFARICVEIDITKPPPEEIILDICGREIVQQVRWDKIPAYCRECKHVGHSSSVCYAAGKSERPPRRNYNTVAPQHTPHEGNGSAGRETNTKASPFVNNEWKWQKKNKGKGTSSSSRPEEGAPLDEVWEGPDIMGDNLDGEVSETEAHMQKGDYLENSASTHRGSQSRPSMHDHGSNGMNRVQDGPYRQVSSNTRGGARGGARGRFRSSSSRSGWSGPEENLNIMSSNKYYSLMANGEYDVEGCGEEDVEAMDIQLHPDQTEDTTLQIDAGEHTNEEDQRIVLFQGGPSLLPGTTPSC